MRGLRIFWFIEFFFLRLSWGANFWLIFPLISFMRTNVFRVFCCIWIFPFKGWTRASFSKFFFSKSFEELEFSELSDAFLFFLFTRACTVPGDACERTCTHRHTHKEGYVYNLLHTQYNIFTFSFIMIYFP